MCLSVPGKLISIQDLDQCREKSQDRQSLTRMGRVSFGGIFKEVSLAYVPEAREGDYVLVHVGFAISVIDEEEAKFVYDYLEQYEGTPL